jgi:N-acyl-D-amino-acid deacylase
MKHDDIRAIALGAALFLVASLAQAQPSEEKLSITGRANPNLSSFDDLMLSFLRDHKVPGGALAVTRQGKLVYARGFGFADVQNKEPVRPQALFRIASLSKPITAVAILQLVEQGKLKLDDNAFDLLATEPHLEADAKFDERLRQITIQQLLNHTAGWDRDLSFDPMFRSVTIAETLGTPPPAQPPHIIRYMLGRPLDFAPGQRYAYSNFGYCILGRIIERLAGQSYENHVRDTTLRPLGIRTMQIGHTLPPARAPGEVHYYAANDRPARAVVGAPGQPVPQPYGAWYLEAMDAHGGWIASAPDLVKFAAAFDTPESCRLLKMQSITQMFARPPGPAGHDPDGKPKAAYYACGWMVRPVGNAGQANTWHTGQLAGTSTLLVRRHDGLDWAVLFNTDADPAGQSLAAAIDPLLHRAADAVKQWPEYDLFVEVGIGGH